MSESARILVVKTSSLGDVVHALPAVSDIVAAHPAARIDWVCEEGFAGIPALHPGVARVIPCAIRRWRKSLWSATTRAEIARFRESLHALRYDIAIDFQGLIKSAWIMRHADAVRHGYAWGNAREPLATLAYGVRHHVAWGQHAIERNRKLAAAALGYALQGPVRYGVGPRARPAINDTRATAGRRSGGENNVVGENSVVGEHSVIGENSVMGGHSVTGENSVVAGHSVTGRYVGEGDYVVALHSTSRADKLWPEANWRAAIARWSATGLSIVLPWGSARERERSDRLAGGVAAARVPEWMDMPELATLFAGARAVVGVDTGLVHLAAATGAPTLAIFGPTDPALTGVVADRAPALNLGGLGLFPEVGIVDATLQRLLVTSEHAGLP